MNVGFTGTRWGMQPWQKLKVETILRDFVIATLREPEEAGHGDCVGADADFHGLIRKLFITTRVIIHPPIISSLRAYCKGDEYRDEATHFARNRQIVREADILLATPYTMQEEALGGTWYTVRYARKVGKTVLVVWPDGTLG